MSSSLIKAQSAKGSGDAADCEGSSTLLCRFLQVRRLLSLRFLKIDKLLSIPIWCPPLM